MPTVLIVPRSVRRFDFATAAEARVQHYRHARPLKKFIKFSFAASRYAIGILAEPIKNLVAEVLQNR